MLQLYLHPFADLFWFVFKGIYIWKPHKLVWARIQTIPFIKKKNFNNLKLSIIWPRLDCSRRQSTNALRSTHRASIRSWTPAFLADTVEISEGVVKLAYTLLFQIPKSPANWVMQLCSSSHRLTKAHVQRDAAYTKQGSPHPLAPHESAWLGSWCQKCPGKTAPNRGPACLIIAWGSYVNFSFLPSPSFPQNVWASHCACINACTLPSVTWGSSKPATSEVRVQVEKQHNRWSLSSIQCRLGTPLVWGEAGRWVGLEQKANFLKKSALQKG